MKKITLILSLFSMIVNISNAQQSKIGAVKTKIYETSPTLDCFEEVVNANLTYGTSDGVEDKSIGTVEIDNSLTPNDSSKHIVFQIKCGKNFITDGDEINDFLTIDNIDQGLSISKSSVGDVTIGDICASNLGTKYLNFIIDINSGFSTVGTKSAVIILKTSKNDLTLTVNINTTAATASIATSNKEVILFSPNPAKEVLNVSSDKTIEQVSLLDMTGKVVSYKNINSKGTTIDTSRLVSGVYILKAMIDGKVTTKKIVKN
jgi:hypothetical protein